MTEEEKKARRKESNAKWKRNNPDKIAANYKRYYAKNKERIAAYGKAYYAKNKEIIRNKSNLKNQTNAEAKADRQLRRFLDKLLGFSI